MSESKWEIKCIMCKSTFDQGNSQNRFCDDCRSSKNRKMRRKYNVKRTAIRKIRRESMV